MNGRTDILEYTSYREFLRDYFAEQRKVNSSFSYRNFVRKAGFLSPMYPILVTQGKRNISEDAVHRFSLAIGFNKKEKQYFETLVSFDQAKTPESRRYYLEVLSNLKKTKIGTPLSEDKFEYISKWYYLAIRELVYLPTFTDDPFWIRKALNGRITIKEAKRAIETLVKLGLIKKAEDGRYVQTDRNLIMEDDIVHEATYHFQSQILALARETLLTTHASERQFSGITMPISEKQFHDIKNMIRDFEGTIERYLDANPDVPTTVYHLNTSFFKLANG